MQKNLFMERAFNGAKGTENIAKNKKFIRHSDGKDNNYAKKNIDSQEC